jgi:molybdopterin converting factor small subunit
VNVNVKLFASLRNFGPERQVLELPAGTTIEEVVRMVGIPPTARLLRIVNGEHRPADEPLRDGDDVAFFPPIAGG